MRKLGPTRLIPIGLVLCELLVIVTMALGWWQSIPSFVTLTVAGLALVILPGWLLSATLEDRPSLLGTFLFGLGSAGAMVLTNQLVLGIPSIPTVFLLHCGWQLALLAFMLTANRTIHFSLKLAQLSLGMVGLVGLALIMGWALTPSLRLEVFDPFYHMAIVRDIAESPGTTVGGVQLGSGLTRTAFSAGDALYGYLSGLTSVRPSDMLYYSYLIVPALLAVIAYGVVKAVSSSGTLALTSAFFSLVVIFTTVGPNPASVALTKQILYGMGGTDKWYSLLLLTTCGLVLSTKAFQHGLSWRSLAITTAALIAPTLYHPQGLPTVSYLALVFGLFYGAHHNFQLSRWQWGLILGWGGITFVVVPVAYSFVYAGSPPLMNSMAPASIDLRWYADLGLPDGHIVTPAAIAGLLMLLPFGLTLLLGTRWQDPLGRLLAAWAWATAMVFVPYVAGALDRLWYPVWLDRLLWPLPFGVMLAYLLFRYMPHTWPRTVLATALIAAALALKPYGLISLDTRTNPFPYATAEMREVVDYFVEQDLTGKVAAQMPGAGTLVDIDTVARILWMPIDEVAIIGARWARRFDFDTADWLILEHSSPAEAHVNLQPSRYERVHQTIHYTIYRVNNFTLGPVDTLADGVVGETPLTPTLIEVVPLDSPYNRLLVGMAYARLGNCEQSLPLIEAVLTEAPFAAPLVVQDLARCSQLDRLHQIVTEHLDERGVSAALLHPAVIAVIPHDQLPRVVDEWLARPSFNRRELETTRQVAQSLANVGYYDLALRAYERIFEWQLELSDWRWIAHWTALSHGADPTLYERAGDLVRASVTRGQEAPLFTWRTRPSLDRTFVEAILCEQRADLDCARRAYERAAQQASRTGSPLALYGWLGTQRLSPAADMLPSQAQSILQAFGLSAPASNEVFLSVPQPGIPVGDVIVHAAWAEPANTNTSLKPTRRLNLTLSAGPLTNITLYAGLDVNGLAQPPIALVIPAGMSVTWPIDLILPLQPQPTLGRVTFRVGSFSAVIAETLLGLPDPAFTATPPLATFDQGLALTNIALTCDAVTFSWLPRQPLNQRYTLFIHLLDANDQLVGQVDERIFNDGYPSDLWLPDYGFQTIHPLPIVPTAVKLNVGWYAWPNGERLLVIAGSTTVDYRPCPSSDS